MATRLPGGRRRRPRARRSPRPKPIQARAIATVEAILAAAAQVFEDHGFAAGTTNRIAERAGVSIGTLYQYFGDKHAIAHALVERHVAGMLARVAAWAAGVLATAPGLRGALRSLVEAALDAHEQEPRLHQVLLEEAPLSADAHALLKRAERDAARTIAGVLRTLREVRRRDLQRTGELLVWLGTDLTHRHTSRPGGVGRAAFVEEATDVLDAFVRAPEGGRALTPLQRVGPACDPRRR